jgi:ribosomal protein L3
MRSSQRHNSLLEGQQQTLYQTFSLSLLMVARFLLTSKRGHSHAVSNHECVTLLTSQLPQVKQLSTRKGYGGAVKRHGIMVLDKNMLTPLKHRTTGSHLVKV